MFFLNSETKYQLKIYLDYLLADELIWQTLIKLGENFHREVRIT